jgi:hypothetical protein
LNVKRIFIGLVVLLLGLFGVSPTSFAQSQGSTTNPSVEDIKKALTETAAKYDIPPEILKAIAYVESGLKQFDASGNPYVSDDNGIGVMQVTPDKTDIPIDIERLKSDYKYNIDIGAQILNSKWNLTYLPKVNHHDRHVLEDWYFAIMAYNGASKANDPNLHPGDTYQDSVYSRIAGSSLIDWNDEHFKFPTFDIRYNGSDTMVFPDGKDYNTDVQTPTQQLYKPGDIIYVDGRDGGANLRSSIGGSLITKLWPYTPLTIESGPYEDSRSDNDFVYYKVKGANHEGYVVSSYLNKGNKDILFSDAGDDQRAAALAFMAINGYAKGYPNGTFGSGESLKREHVAVILDNILHLSLPSDYQMKANDVSKNNDYYIQLEKAEYHQLLGGGGKLRPKEYLTRSQMAQVMVEAFESEYQKPTSVHIFKDQAAIWNLDAVNTIYFNKVTVADPFLPGQPITRSQFALFIYRTMVDIPNN